MLNPTFRRISLLGMTPIFIPITKLIANEYRHDTKNKWQDNRAENESLTRYGNFKYMLIANVSKYWRTAGKLFRCKKTKNIVSCVALPSATHVNNCKKISRAVLNSKLIICGNWYVRSNFPFSQKWLLFKNKKRKYKANTIKHTNTEAKDGPRRKMRKKNMVIVLNFNERNDAINKNTSNKTFQ